ncbi:MAG: hypothetical protein HY288_16870, partial [Planctomycetia bacterium]|nr:hypothetical protein [Planctomycetia bacterium]
MGQRLWQSGWRVPAWAAMLLLAAAVDSSPAQEPAAPAEPTRSEPSSAKPGASPALPGEVLPKVYVLKDKDGNLQAMPGIAFEEFMELYRLKNRLDQQNERPRYSIQSLTLAGSAVGQRADLVAQCSLVLNVAGWVRVPLRLSGAVLRERPGFEGAGEHAVDFESEGDGYVFWIRGEPGETQQITLKLLVPLSQVGPVTHLRLSLPRTAVSQLQLQVPLERAVARMSGGNTLDSTQPIEGGKTQFKFVGVGGEVDLSWRPAETPLAGLPTVLEANGAQTIRINGRSISTECKLSVHSFGGEFDRFQVRLPPGADYAGTAQAGISLAPIETAGSKSKLYEVKLEKKTSGPVEVRLITERTHNSAQADETLEMAGFEVLGAVRQWGTIAVQVEGNWQILWGELGHVRQVNEILGPPRRDDLTAAFEYFVQPYSLPARIVPQKTRVWVEPEYVLLVGGSEAQLRAKLKYTIRGAKIRTLELDLPGWQLDLVGPANLVNVDAAVAGQASSVVVPLWQATSGEVELTLEAHQKISAESPSVTLELPRPRAEVTAPANVAVLPADNIELVVRADETAALASQTVRPQIKLPERQQDPLYFRTDGPAPKFVASIKAQQQAISATLATQLELDAQETRVQQRMTYQVAYQPADHLVLGVPRAIRSDRLKVSLDGQRLLPVPMRERIEGDASEPVPMRVVLPTARIGRCELQINYVVGHEKLTGVGNSLVNVPLVVPGEGQLTDNEVVVVPKSGISVSYSKGPWRQEARGAAAGNGAGLLLTARRALGEIGLTVSSKERPVENATTIERAWIQTRLIDSERQDRVVYRFTTSNTHLKIALPVGADLGSLEMHIDGRRLTPELDR